MVIMKELEEKREKLNEDIEKYGFDYSKVIDADKLLHEDINKIQSERLKQLKGAKR